MLSLIAVLPTASMLRHIVPLRAVSAARTKRCVVVPLFFLMRSAVLLYPMSICISRGVPNTETAAFTQMPRRLPSLPARHASIHFARKTLSKHLSAVDAALVDVEAMPNASNSVGIAVRSGSARRTSLVVGGGWNVPLQVELFRRGTKNQNFFIGVFRRFMVRMGILKPVDCDGLRRYERRVRLISRIFQFPLGRDLAHRNLEVRIGRSAWRKVPRTDFYGSVKANIWLSEQEIEASELDNGQVDVQIRLASDPEGSVVRTPAHLDIGQKLGLISDIDDTIKVTRVFCGLRSVLRTTFLRTHKPVRGMAELYRKYAKEGTSFHYVSKSPPELHEMLLNFLDTHGFPRGTLLLCPLIKKGRKNFKMQSIEALLQEFPERNFILVGDSGEKDPQIYAEILKRHPERIAKVLIRQVHRRNRVDEAMFKDFDASQWQIFRQPSEVQVPS
eukprot:TRINITY_DN31283_c0_g1_i1.p1 TRINITY_DN31283_c0_g1~~TRINITY_DN31283_c0_g1_i1.p1  ORF type:complete len:445 (+),score=43.95 TRINITY_DN31283_c0_g1_i1:58-1392(+)